MSPQRHKRNTKPRPGLIISPPTGLGIESATYQISADGGTLICQSGLINPAGATADIWDITANIQASSVITAEIDGRVAFLYNFPGPPTDKTGHSIGWKETPVGLQAVQLTLAAASSIVPQSFP